MSIKTSNSLVAFNQKIALDRDNQREWQHPEGAFTHGLKRVNIETG
jgi:hypothetical protein